MTDLLQKVRALEAEHNQKPAKRENNRARYPEIAIFVDRLREVFGEVRVVKITERILENERPK